MDKNSVVGIVGCGFIGKNLARFLIAKGAKLRVLDRNPCPLEFEGFCDWTCSNFFDENILETFSNGVDILYHMLSTTVPGDKNLSVSVELADNVLGSYKLLEACVRWKVKRIVFISSASVYGLQDKFPINEQAATWPISAHGIQKLTIEKILWLAHFEKSIEVKIVRLSNPYGPGQSISGRQGFIGIAIGALIQRKNLLLRSADLTIRDFLYIDDAVSALFNVGTMDNIPELLNISSGVGYSIMQVVDLIELISGKHLLVSHGVARNVDIPRSVLDPSLAIKCLGDYRRTTLHDGLRLTINSNMLSQ
jgi:UDP-glucose 4-epimerase